MEHVLHVPPVERYTRNSRLPRRLPDRGAVSPACSAAGQGHESPCMYLWGRGNTFRGRHSWADCDGDIPQLFESLLSFLDDSALILSREAYV